MKILFTARYKAKILLSYKVLGISMHFLTELTKEKLVLVFNFIQTTYAEKLLRYAIFQFAEHSTAANSLTPR